MDNKSENTEKIAMCRREFLKRLIALGAVAAASPLFFGEQQLRAAQRIISEGSGICSSSYSCTGGSGQCGSSYNCSGQGSNGNGKCGSSYNCAGGSGKFDQSGETQQRRSFAQVAFGAAEVVERGAGENQNTAIFHKFHHSFL